MNLWVYVNINIACLLASSHPHCLGFRTMDKDTNGPHCFLSLVYSASIPPVQSLMSTVQHCLGLFFIWSPVIYIFPQDVGAEVIGPNIMANLMQFSLPYGCNQCLFVSISPRLYCLFCCVS